jgi:hypothetical protein
MENNLDNLQEDEVIIEDIDVDALQTLDETLEQDITEAKVNPKEIDGEDDDDKEDDGEGLDKTGDEDSDVDNDGDSDEADEYLTTRRKTVAKKIAKEETNMDEADDSNKIIKVEIPYLSDERNDRDIEMHKVTKKAKASADKNGFKITKVDDAGEEIYVTFSGPKSKLLKFVRQHMGPSNKNDTDEELLDTFGESFESEDITRLIESEEGLTEEFKDKAAIIFEAAVSSKVNEIEATLVEQYESRLAEEVESVKSVLEEQVDSYLTYAVESWMEENKVAVESSLRTQLAENFISALKTVFVENYVDVPDSKVDLFAQLEAENSSLKEESAKFSRIAESLADRVDTLVREQIVTEASTGLADTQVDRLKKLVEDIEFVDAATYRKKVATIKEFYLNGSQETEDTTLTEETGDSFISTETIVEGESMNDDLSPEMKSYLTALSRMSKATTADLL